MLLIEDIILILSWIVLSFIVAAVAAHNDRSFMQNLIISLCLSPLIGFTILMINNQQPLSRHTLIMTDQFKVCPDCDELVRTKALKCRYCGADLTATKNT